MKLHPLTSIMPQPDDSIEALEALLEFRQSVCRSNYSFRTHPDVPVPDPLNNGLPNLIEADSIRPHRERINVRTLTAMNSALSTVSRVNTVPNPLRRLKDDIYIPSSAMPPFEFNATSELGTKNDEVSKQAFSTMISHKLAAKTESSRLTVHTDKIQDALKSKSQRGKKRRNLNDEERMELTRTRNRQHAKCTRMKKKTRYMELIEMERIHLLLKKQCEFGTRRRSHVFNMIHSLENTCTPVESAVTSCPHLRHLKELACERLQNANISVIGSTADTVALTAENTALVNISVCGIEYESRRSKSLSAIVSVSFKPGTLDVSSLSLLWVSPSRKESIFPCISVSSFELEVPSSGF